MFVLQPNARTIYIYSNAFYACTKDATPKWLRLYTFEHHQILNHYSSGHRLFVGWHWSIKIQLAGDGFIGVWCHINAVLLQLMDGFWCTRERGGLLLAPVVLVANGCLRDGNLSKWRRRLACGIGQFYVWNHCVLLVCILTILICNISDRDHSAVRCRIRVS